jgi:hypothetical protein
MDGNDVVGYLITMKGMHLPGPGVPIGASFMSTIHLIR